MPDLLAPFAYEFFRQGLLVATLAGALCGLLGVYVVLRGMSYIGHGLLHAILGGYAEAGVVGLGGVFVVGAAGPVGRRHGAGDRRRHPSARTLPSGWSPRPRSRWASRC